MNRIASILRNVLHIVSGALLAQTSDQTSQTIGGILALVSTLWSQRNTKPPTGAVPVEVPISRPESTIIDDGVPRPATRKTPHALLCLFAFGLAGSALFAGCATNPRAVAWHTLDDLRTVVDAAERAYGDAWAAGRVTAAQEKSTDQAIEQFHAAFAVAVEAARLDYAAPAPPDLQRLADSLVKLIYSFATPIPPPSP